MVLPDVDCKMSPEVSGNRSISGPFSCLDGFADVLNHRFSGCKVAVAQFEETESSDFDGFDARNGGDGRSDADTIVLVCPFRNRNGSVVRRNEQRAVFELVREFRGLVFERAHIFIGGAEENLSETEEGMVFGDETFQGAEKSAIAHAVDEKMDAFGP